MGRAVCDAQTALNQLGFRSGHPDCWWGTSTADALREFQKKEGLPVSGELDTLTMEALSVRYDTPEGVWSLECERHCARFIGPAESYRDGGGSIGLAT